MDNRLFLLSGEIDLENRYPSAVMITVGEGEQISMRCSGVAISRQAVLTAGHCVCARRRGGPPGEAASSLIDASQCARTATVETLLYKPRAEREEWSKGSTSKSYQGTIQPHPALRIVLDPQGHVVSSSADLALILLDEPLEIQPALLGDEAVRLNDFVTIVGYGYDETADAFGHDRRSSVNKAAELLAPGGEIIRVEQPGKHLFRSDSGGPCFIKRPAGLSLVGVSSRWLGEGATFTSIHGYRAWLRERLLSVHSHGG